MSTLPLPAQSVRLSSAGFDRIYRVVRQDPALAKILAQRIEEDPRSALNHVFKLTKNQLFAIANTTDDELRRRAARVVAELRSASPGKLRFDPGLRQSDLNLPIDYHTLTCGCSFDDEDDDNV
jgi:hypothetical protein